MTEPVRVYHSRAEMLEKVREYMVATFGPPRDLDAEGKDRWMERAGLLWDFVAQHYPRE